jgi:hypothetical protein
VELHHLTEYLSSKLLVYFLTSPKCCDLGAWHDDGPRDLVNTVVERLLTPTGQRRRRWHRQETISACFARTMRSIVWDWWRRRQIVNFVAIGGDDGDTVISRVPSPGPDPERELMAQQALDEVFTMLKDDKNTLEIALALASGGKPGEIRERYHLTQTPATTRR